MRVQSIDKCQMMGTWCPICPPRPADLHGDFGGFVGDQGQGLCSPGDFALAGVGGEVVTPIFQRLMKQTPFAKTIFATNVNDRIGYIVEDAAYDTPTFEVNGSPVARGCAEDAIANGLSDMFAKLAR